MGIAQETAPSTQPLSLTPFGEACRRLDLTAILEILEKIGYKDDEGIANEVCCFSPGLNILLSGCDKCNSSLPSDN